MSGRFQGWVEVVGADRITGWCVDTQALGTRPVLELLLRGQVVAQSQTSTDRPDVALYFKSQRLCGFGFERGPGLGDLQPGEVLVRPVGGTTALPFLEPHWAQAEALPAPAVAEDAGLVEGRLEVVSPELLSGWALDRRSPGQPAQVEIEVDGELVATVLANGYAQRFLAQVPDGRLGFCWPVPLGCWQGGMRRLAARVRGTATPLEGEPIPVYFPARMLPPPAPPPPPAALAPAAVAPPGLVSAVVLNRNGAALLEALFASMARHVPGPLEVVLVDHASTDASLAVAARWQERLGIRVEALGENRSFSASNNHGARLARGEYLLLLNNDISFTSNPLPAMLRLLAAPGVVAAGARLAEPVPDAEGVVRPVLHHDGIGFRLELGGGQGQACWLPYEVEAAGAVPGDAPGPVPAATAALLLLRRAEYLAMGGLDEGFDYGFEDVELCLRLGRQGGVVAMAREAVALHQRSATRTGPGVAVPSAAVAQATARRDQENRRHLLHAQGAWLKRQLRRAALEGEPGWREHGCRIGFMQCGGDAAQGMAGGLGWQGALLGWGEPDWRGLDVLVVGQPGLALRAGVNATPGLLLVAWVQGDVPGWAAPGALAGYDVVLAGDTVLAEALRLACGREVAVLAGPDWPAAAELLGGALRQAAQGLRFGLKLPVAPGEGADWARGEALAAALRGLGHAARLDGLGEWQDGLAATDDVAVVLRHAAGQELDARALNFLWAGQAGDGAWHHVLADDATPVEAVAQALVRRARGLLGE